MNLKVSQSSLSLEYVRFLSLYFVNNISVFLKLFEIINFCETLKTNVLNKLILALTGRNHLGIRILLLTHKLIKVSFLSTAMIICMPTKACARFEHMSLCVQKYEAKH